MTTWVDDLPPVAGPLHPQAIYVEKLRPLIDQPGRWAIIKSGSPGAMHQAAQALRLRQYHVPAGRWEFRVRSFRRGVHTNVKTANLYARYLDDTSDGGVCVDDLGRRICPQCGAQLRRETQIGFSGKASPVGPWPKMCDVCWDEVDTKYARRRKKRKV